MRKSWFGYGEISSEELYNNLSKDEKKILDEYKDYKLISASEERADESQREILRFREITGIGFKNIDLEDLRYFLKQLKESNFADYTKNKIKGYVQSFLRWKFKDWSARFENFDDIHFNSDAQRLQPITSKEIITKEEFEKLMKAEPTLYWKTFLICQYMGGLRTGECRHLLKSSCSFDDDGFCYIKVSSKKNKNGTSKFREIPLDTNASYYLQELKKEQKNKGIISEWVFPSPQNPKEPISKAVNDWFKKLTKRAMGREVTNYVACRHTRGTELQRLVKENLMSKDNAVEFMGHSEKMFDKVYSHMNKDDIKRLMKKQIYNFNSLPPEKKHELELEIDKLKEKQDSREKEYLKMFNNLRKELEGIKKLKG